MNEQQGSRRNAIVLDGWRRAASALLSALAAVSIAGCGGGDESVEPPAASSEASATIGAAGGTLDGPDGTQVVIPPLALRADTVIRIARSSTGAPADTPQGYEPLGATYEFTPHDIVFERPVTLRIPVPATAAASAPEAFAASPTKPWHPVESTVVGGFANWQSTSFSWLKPWACAPQANDPHPCAWARLTTLAETATTGALALTSADPFYGRTYALSQAATVRLTFRYQAARDCGDARLSVTRFDQRNNVIGSPQVLLDNLPVALTAKPATTSTSEGSHTLDVAFTTTDNGTAAFGSRISCQRLFQQPPTPVHRQSDVDGVVIVVNAPAVTAAAPPVITQQPADLSVAVGVSAAFTLAATAPDSLTLDWQRSNDAGATWSSLSFSGATYSLVAAAADNGARFRARVCNVKGTLPADCIFSAGATLTVGAPPVVAAGTKIAAGFLHTCAIRADGSVACWGANSSAQIGVGDRIARVSPTTVALPEASRSVAAGFDASCALGVSGTLRCWGDNFGSTRPVVVGGLGGVDVGGGGIREVTVGRGHACVLTVSGTVWCRGSNSAGQLGDGTLVYSDGFVLVQAAGNGAPLSSIAGISATEFRTCAVSNGGSVLCWGNDGTPVTRATPIAGIVTAGTISGECAMLSSGPVVCWSGIANAAPAQVAGLGDIVRIAFGGPNCALANARVYCWGAGLFGNGQVFEVRPAADVVAGLDSVGDVAAGGGHTCALRFDGSLRCWGTGGLGQLGVGDIAGRTTPTDVPDAIGWARP